VLCCVGGVLVFAVDRGPCPACPIVPIIVPGCAGPSPSLIGGVLCLGGSFSISGLLSGVLSGSVSSMITVSIITSPPIALPVGCTAVEFVATVGGGFGLTIGASGATSVLSSTIITTPAVTAAALVQLSGAGRGPLSTACVSRPPPESAAMNLMLVGRSLSVVWCLEGCVVIVDEFVSFSLSHRELGAT
jgi:hypothetical protein